VSVAGRAGAAGTAPESEPALDESAIFRMLECPFHAAAKPEQPHMKAGSKAATSDNRALPSDARRKYDPEQTKRNILDVATPAASMPVYVTPHS